MRSRMNVAGVSRSRPLPPHNRYSEVIILMQTLSTASSLQNYAIRITERGFSVTEHSFIRNLAEDKISE